MPYICLTPESYERIEHYAEKTGITVERAASEAIEQWMDETGDSVLVVLERRRKKPRSVAEPVILSPTLQLVARN